jgi:hypothetical protein
MNYYQVQSSRALSTLRDGSPNYLHTFGAINAGANEYVVVESTFPGARQAHPLLHRVLTHHSGENLDLEINGAAAAPIPAGVIWAQSDSPIWSFRITNNDATNVASGEVAANLHTPPMTQSQFTRLNELYGD